MNPWPKHPVIYEINTWVWLQELSQEYKSPVTLAKVPREKWDGIADLKVDAVWFMGVWERSPAGIAIANQNKGLLEDFRHILSDFRPEDNVGSPYCVRRYVVDKHLGSREGLAIARRELAKRGLKLILDFVPNHVAPDHPWATEHPEYFIQGNDEDLRRDTGSFIGIGKKIFACGQDPFFPAWPDVLQLNAFDSGLRKAVVETLTGIADQADGVRCDMAMLVMNYIFERTWGPRAGARPSAEYWPEVIQAIKTKYPDFLFMAEAYWDQEWELQQQGFNFCYDKKLYDRLKHDNAESVQLHLCADPAYQDKLVRFIENHDEPRAAATFTPAKERAAAVATMTIPGAKLLHEGQLEGRRVRLPVFLSRRPSETVDSDLKVFYQRLLAAMKTEALQGGEWLLCDRSGWPDNPSFLNLVAWCWHGAKERYLVVVNLSGERSQGRVKVPWDELKSISCRLTDLFTGAVYERKGEEILNSGLYVDLEAFGFHFLKF
jgi:hypothetical protein